LYNTTDTVERVNLKRHSDRLDILLARYEREIRETEEKLRALKTGRADLNLMVKEPARPATLQPGPEELRGTGITKTVVEAIQSVSEKYSGWPRSGAGRLASLLPGRRFLTNMLPRRASPSNPSRARSHRRPIFQTCSNVLWRIRKNAMALMGD
jgi:hypothetical protein